VFKTRDVFGYRQKVQVIERRVPRVPQKEKAHDEGPFQYSEAIA
jgi:hypothetical protein